MELKETVNEILRFIARLGSTEMPRPDPDSEDGPDPALEAVTELRDTIREAAENLPSEVSDPEAGDSADPRPVGDDSETLAHELDARMAEIEEAGAVVSPDQLIGKTQAVIASGTAGSVKLCALMAGTPTEFGGAFNCYNLGPSEAPSGAFVLLQQGDHGQPCFQYAVNNTLALADNTGVISSSTPVVGSATTAKRSDAADGLKIVAATPGIEFKAANAGLGVIWAASGDMSADGSIGASNTIGDSGKLVHGNHLHKMGIGNGIEYDAGNKLFRAKIDASTITFNGSGQMVASAATPAAHASTHNAGGGDGMAIDAAAATGSLRTLGTAATAACAGNDARLSDARTPTAHDVLSASHGDTTAGAVTRGDVITGQGATPKWARLAITAPSAGLMNYLGAANGDTEPAYKALFDATNPADLGTAAPGTATVAARRDHVHNAPAAGGSFTYIDSDYENSFTIDGAWHNYDTGYGSAKAILMQVSYSDVSTCTMSRNSSMNSISIVNGAMHVIPCNAGVFRYLAAGSGSPGMNMYIFGYWT